MEALPEATAVVTSVCSLEDWMSMASLPSALHCSLALLTSSSCVVPVCTATFTPHRFEESTLFGLPFCTT